MAFVLGLAPGKTTEVPIVIVAEDGVTSLRYYLNIFRADAPQHSTGGSSGNSWSLGSGAYLGSGGAPSGSLELRSGGRGSDAKESVAPGVQSAKAARQPGIVSSAFCTAFMGMFRLQHFLRGQGVGCVWVSCCLGEKH